MTEQNDGAGTPRGANKRVSLLDVARHANVSRATASLVLRDSPLVAEATRRRVLQSQRELGYVYNRAAASLRTQRTHTVGLVVNDISNPFYAEFALGVEQGLSGTDYLLFVANTADAVQRQEQVVRALHEYGVDGLLITPAADAKASSPSLRSAPWMPIVLTIRYLKGVRADYVGANNVLGAQKAVEHLIEHGHRRIAYLGGPPTSSSRRDRLAGYSRALEEHGLSTEESLLVPGPASRAGGQTGMRHLLSLSSPPSAVFCYNDVVASGAILELWASGRTPGRDVAVVGFDDIADARIWRPALTTISVAPQRLGEAAAEVLTDRIEHPEKRRRRIELTPELAVRESCGCHSP